ncbi:MAG: hypothetical protein DMF09_00800 [Verrucomicrobia bacterium]|nr:MAG: hypothetical protein DMF09_00800 [Verrucomicrobiota bacterium]
MFYCYVLSNQKTGRRYVGSCKNLNDRIRRIMPAIPRLRSMAHHGSCSTAKVLSLAPKQRNASDITKLGAAEMN